MLPSYSSTFGTQHCFRAGGPPAGPGWMDWQTMPDLALQRIFQFLSKRERLSAALSCRRWLEAFYNPQLWRTFVFAWRPYPADQHKRMYDLAMYRLYLEFAAVGRHFRRVVVPATSDFFALHGFLQQWRLCIEQHAAVGVAVPVRAFHLTFACEVIGSQAFGTGGRLLDALKEVLGRMAGLRALVLDDLLLDVADALTVLDEVALASGASLRRLSVVSVCKQPAGLYAAPLFPNLQLLRLSPPQLNADVLAGLAAGTRLGRLVLRQDAFTVWPEAGPHAMPHRAPDDEDWVRMARAAPWLRVRLEVAGLHASGGIMWPAAAAPVDQVLISADGLALSPALAARLAAYGGTLAEFGVCATPDPAPDEQPLAWAELAAACCHLSVLHLHGRAPAWLLVMLAASLPRLAALRARRRLLADDPLPPAARHLWPDAPEDALVAADRAAACPAAAEAEVALLLRQPRWRLLSDAEFRRGGPLDDAEFLYA